MGTTIAEFYVDPARYGWTIEAVRSENGERTLGLALRTGPKEEDLHLLWQTGPGQSIIGECEPFAGPWLIGLKRPADSLDVDFNPETR